MDLVNNMDPILNVTDLNIEFFDKDKPQTVVYDFDLTMYPGEIVGLVGESGSGKSMSALSIAGLLSRANLKKKGSIIFNNIDMLTAERDKLRKIQGDDIGMIFQEPLTSLNPVLRIEKQVEECLKLHRDYSKEERHERVLNALKDVEIRDPELVMRQYPHELSGGMRQRVMIAMAMINEPKLLIADEPTTALDVTVQAQIIKLLKKLNEEKNTAILFISHDLSLVKTLCKRVLVMKNGYIVESGEADEIFKSPKDEYTKKLIAAIPKIEGKVFHE